MDGIIVLVIVLTAVIGTLFLLLRRKPEKVCATCGTVGKPALRAKGSLGLEIVLWFLGVLPGIVYSLWRLDNHEEACRACRATTMIPVDSPAGKKLLDRAS